ncbi:MAG TPA: hypothetical protein VKZ48_07295 [Burkholderiales bacterium]|nr:hypothetical protein [Burkholderiales bacterium]
MKSRMMPIAAALFALALAGCGQEEAPADPGGRGTMTPPGAAGDAAGNQAPANVTDDVPTQQQLDPVPPENQPGGTTQR